MTRFLYTWLEIFTLFYDLLTVRALSVVTPLSKEIMEWEKQQFPIFKLKGAPVPSNLLISHLPIKRPYSAMQKNPPVV